MSDHDNVSGTTRNEQSPGEVHCVQGYADLTGDGEVHLMQGYANLSMGQVLGYADLTQDQFENFTSQDGDMQQETQSSMQGGSPPRGETGGPQLEQQQRKQQRSSSGSQTPDETRTEIRAN